MSILFCLLLATAVLFKVYLVNNFFSSSFFSPPLNVHRQHGLAAACFIVSLGTAVGPILALRGARHGILLGLLLNGTSAEMRTCKGEGGGERGLVHAAPHQVSVPPRGLATTAVFLLGAQHWLGSCLFLFLFFWPMSSSRNGCVYCASVESMLRLCFHMRVCAWVCVCRSWANANKILLSQGGMCGAKAAPPPNPSSSSSLRLLNHIAVSRFLQLTAVSC